MEQIDRQTFINLLHKIMYCFKFRNDVEFDEYREIIFSPLYVSLFKQIREEMFAGSPEKGLKNEMSGYLNEKSEEYNRIESIIKNAEFNSELNFEVKKELVELVVFYDVP